MPDQDPIDLAVEAANVAYLARWYVETVLRELREEYQQLPHAERQEVKAALGEVRAYVAVHKG